MSLERPSNSRDESSFLEDFGRHVSESARSSRQMKRSGTFVLLAQDAIRIVE